MLHTYLDKSTKIIWESGRWRTPRTTWRSRRWAWPLSTAYCLWPTSSLLLCIPGLCLTPPETHAHDVDTSALSTTLLHNCCPLATHQAWEGVLSSSSAFEKGGGARGRASRSRKPAEGRMVGNWAILGTKKHSVKKRGCRFSLETPPALWLSALMYMCWAVIGCGVQTLDGPSIPQGPRQGPLPACGLRWGNRASPLLEIF